MSSFLKKPSFLLIIFLLLGCASLRYTLFVPSQIEQYCRRISGAKDKINQAIKTCIKQEHDAKDRLSKMTIPSQIEIYCEQLSESTGGSYQVKATCVQQELEAL